MLKSISAIVLVGALGALAFAHDKGDKPDGWITTKTKLKLWTTPGIDSTDISVDSMDGAVTLYGKVETAAAKQKAEVETKNIDGVKRVHNLLQVVPGSRAKFVAKSDKEVRDAVERALKNDKKLKDSSVEVRSVDNGVVLLGGKVADVGDELLAVRDAMTVEGVRRVATEMKGVDQAMEVDREARGGDADHEKKNYDGWVTTEVKMHLIGEEKVPAAVVHVDTQDGVVTLFGTVPTDEAREAAEKAARKADGVERVKNDLTVVPSSRKEFVKAKDDEIEKDLKKALERREAFSDVSVDVKGGVVKLTGTVPSRHRKLEAAVVSRTTRGVRAVDNALKVKKED